MVVNYIKIRSSNQGPWLHSNMYTNLGHSSWVSQVTLAVKIQSAHAGDLRNMGLIPGRSPGVRNGNPLQYSCLGNPMAGGSW